MMRYYPGAGIVRPRSNPGQPPRAIRTQVERGYREFAHHDPRGWETIPDPPSAPMHPAGGLARIWYDSDKIMQPGDAQGRKNSYVHCVLAQPDPSHRGKCVCGHGLADHDEVEAHAIVYQPATAGRGAEGPRRPRRPRWPKATYQLGTTLGFDIVTTTSAEQARSGRGVSKVRLSPQGRLLCAPDQKRLIVTDHGGRLRAFIAGGSLRVGPAGIED